MNKNVSNLLSLKFFNEDKDKENLENSAPSSIQSVVINLSFVFSLFSFLLIINNPADNNALILLAIALSLKAIEVLINWHLGLKSIAKNGLILIILLTFIFVYLRGF